MSLSNGLKGKSGPTRDISGALDSSYMNLQNISNISISIASPEDILAWSHGEVRKSETISYRTYKPENDGLFSARIFGPTRDYECQCGKYKRMKYRGIVCEKCGVEITTSRVRRDRLGHIELVSPVMHTLFLRRTNSPVSGILGITVKDLEKIVYFESYLVTDPGNTTMQRNQVLSEFAYNSALEKFGESFKVSSGAEAVRSALERVDLKEEIEIVNEQMKKTRSETKTRALLRKLRLVQDFINSGNRPEWMVLVRLSVLPPDLRPLVQLDGGRFVSSDLNELYRRVINRNDRLRRMLNAKAPQIIIRNEKRMLQESVDALFDNSRRAVVAKSSTGRQLKSLSDYLKGKQGRFRQNLLGKRVDYSGRSVIMVGPSLRLHECGLPKIMALELFKPFIFSKLLMYGKVSSVRNAKKMVEQKLPEVWEILEEVIKDHPVLLNRAPTLHRLNIQAFQPRLIEAKAIQLHPLVCKSFNADFDGDQMAVHVPLSIEAQVEAWVLMLSSNNILSPQNGDPVIIPTKDMVVGLYYMTAALPRKSDRLRCFDSDADMVTAVDNGVIKINTLIKYYYSYLGASDPKDAAEVHSAETTLGRVMVYQCLPQDGRIPFEDFNIAINNKNVAKLLRQVYNVYGQEMTVEFADRLKSLGFEYSTKSGLSFGKDDMIVPSVKQQYINETLEKIKLAEQQYAEGYITFREKYNQVTDRWSECTDKVASVLMSELAKTKDTENVSSVYIMMLSGARVSEPVMRQIAGMRGLIAKPSGEIIEAPIISSFKEGMTVLEYFNSAHGARKGAADTALKTADAGYLTRRLVDVAQDCIVTENDCGTTSGITYSAKIVDGKVTRPLSKIVFGRVLAEDVKDNNDNILLRRGDLIDHFHIETLEKAEILSVKVRCLVLCEAKEGVCSMCYGKDLSSDALVSKGEVVGIIAAQSIGEPGAQLTMRTFHIGGAASRSIEKSSLSAEQSGIVHFERLEFVTNSEGDNIVVSQGAKIYIKSDDGKILSKNNIPYAATVFVKHGDKVSADEKMGTWDPYNTYIIAEYDGFIRLTDFVVNVSFKERAEDDAGVAQKVITDWTNIDKSLNPGVLIVNEDGSPVAGKNGVGVAKYILPIDAIISLKHEDKITKGSIIARIPRESVQVARDITGGLPRVEDIFEARVPKEPAIIAETDGVVEFANDYKTRNHLVIRSVDGSDKSTAYNIPRGKHIKVQEGSFIHKGDVIVDGKLDPHDILAVSGINALAHYIIEEVQQVYRLQGVEIDNKHIEIIVRYMLQKIEVIDRGDLPVINMQQRDIKELYRMNEEAVQNNKQPATYRRVLQGITRASLKTESFISAASFQETSRVLMEAAVAGAKDYLKGMKENVIVGRLAPAGTGYIVLDMMRKAAEARKSAKLSQSEGQELEIFGDAFDLGDSFDSASKENTDGS